MSLATTTSTPTEWDDEDDPTTSPYWPAGARVVVVDDDGELRTSVRNALSREGYDIQEAASGEALLRALADIALGGFPLDGVDLIVLDNRMPGLTGLEALRAIRASGWTTPTVLMTAYPSPRVFAQAASLAAAVLSKPFTREALSRMVVHTLLAGRRSVTTP